jgi:hypothetical protein
MRKKHRSPKRRPRRTCDRLDQVAENGGLRSSDVVEQTLLFFMEAHRALPDEALIPTRIVLEASSFDRLIESRARPSMPTRALKALMRGARRHAPTLCPTDSSR